MEKIYALMLALFAAFAFSAIAVTAAFAETATEYLISGNPAVAGQLVESEGELLLADHKGGIFGEEVMPLCSWKELTEVLSSVDIDITTVYPLGATDPETLSSSNISCTTQAGICSSPVARAIDLDWLTELRLLGTTPLNFLEPESGTNNPGWTIECSGVAEDTCTGKATVEVKNEAGGVVDAFFNEQTGICSRGGTGSALVEGLVTLSSETAGLSLEVMGS